MPAENNRLAELKRAYAAQLKRKDSEIEWLKKQNELLMKTAIRQSEKVRELEELLKKTEKQKREELIH